MLGYAGIGTIGEKPGVIDRRFFSRRFWLRYQSNPGMPKTSRNGHPATRRHPASRRERVAAEVEDTMVRQCDRRRPSSARFSRSRAPNDAVFRSRSALRVNSAFDCWRARCGRNSAGEPPAPRVASPPPGLRSPRNPPHRDPGHLRTTSTLTLRAPLPFPPVPQPGGGTMTRSTYRTVSKSSNVDESLFGYSKNGSKLRATSSQGFEKIPEKKREPAPASSSSGSRRSAGARSAPPAPPSTRPSTRCCPAPTSRACASPYPS